jgi:hypothetical protein
MTRFDRIPNSGDISIGHDPISHPWDLKRDQKKQQLKEQFPNVQALL